MNVNAASVERSLNIGTDQIAPIHRLNCSLVIRSERHTEILNQMPKAPKWAKLLFFKIALGRNMDSHKHLLVKNLISTSYHFYQFFIPYSCLTTEKPNIHIQSTTKNPLFVTAVFNGTKVHNLIHCESQFREPAQRLQKLNCKMFELSCAAKAEKCLNVINSLMPQWSTIAKSHPQLVVSLTAMPHQTLLPNLE